MMMELSNRSEKHIDSNSNQKYHLWFNCLQYLYHLEVLSSTKFKSFHNANLSILFIVTRGKFYVKLMLKVNQ